MDLKDLQHLDKYQRTRLINQLSGIRTAYLIGTQSLTQTTNLAIFNSLVHLGADPPLLGFVMRPLTVERHTYENIKSTGFYTLNQVPLDFIDNAHLTSAKFDRNVSEFEACGFEEVYIHNFSAPFVKESAVKFGMKYMEEHTVAANGTVLMVGSIECLILPDNATDVEGNIDYETLSHVCVSGLDTYYGVTKIVNKDYARPPKS